MSGRPLIISSLDDAVSVTAPRARVLEQVPFGDPAIDEAWLQRLLERHPEVLPLAELDYSFGPLRFVARELSTGVGPLDLLAVSPSGFLTVVETKLYRNPQSRREVLGQILDYCSRLATWSYEDLVAAVASAKHRASDSADPLLAAARGSVEAVEDERRFRDTVTESLRHGRFLLMIVGDGFRDTTQHLLDHVQRFMHLQFTIRLVELQLFREPGTTSPLFAFPRLAARTQEVTRAIVRLKDAAVAEHVVVEGVRAQNTTPPLEQFIDTLRQNKAPIADAAAELLGLLQELDIYPDPVDTGLSLRFSDPAGSSQEFRILRVTFDGYARFGALKRQLEAQGLSGDIALDYARTVAAWIAHATVNSETGNIDGANGKTLNVPLGILATERRDEYVAAVKKLLDEITNAPRTKSPRDQAAGRAQG
jgi:hypothetical protein